MGHHGRFGIEPSRAASVFAPRSTGTQAPRFLIVDDHALMRHGLSLALKLRYPACTVFEAGSLAEAVRRVRSVGNLSAVLFDLTLGDANGVAGVETMLGILDGVPLVVISGSLDNDLVADCIRAGARGFLPKGGNAEVLDHALPIILEGGLYAPLPSPMGMAPAPTGASPVGGPPAREARTPPPRSGSLPSASSPPNPAPNSPPRPPMNELTERQREILQLLLQGQSNKEIARTLGIVEGTIKVHLRSVMQRLGVRNRTQLALVAARAGLTPTGLTPQ